MRLLWILSFVALLDSMNCRTFDGRGHFEFDCGLPDCVERFHYRGIFHVDEENIVQNSSVTSVLTTPNYNLTLSDTTCVEVAISANARSTKREFFIGSIMGNQFSQVLRTSDEIHASRQGFYNVDPNPDRIFWKNEVLVIRERPEYFKIFVKFIGHVDVDTPEPPINIEFLKIIENCILNYEDDVELESSEIKEILKDKDITSGHDTGHMEIEFAEPDFPTIFHAYKEWTYGIMPYDIDRDDPIWLKKAVLNAIKHYETNLQHIVKIRPKTIDDEKFVLFKYDDRPGKCGRTIRKGSMIIIIYFGGYGCIEGSNYHEIGHGFGFAHIHKKDHIDKWLDIVWDNIKPEKWSQYAKCGDCIAKPHIIWNDPRILCSILSYKRFSGNAIDPKKEVLHLKIDNPEIRECMGQRTGLDASDIGIFMSIYGGRD